ncbi:hypothetical protein QR680_014868 [Steinernema hermaphroditum]|uniref:Uncharacterized protein n=1 Tax=Steinernema hermaphroditum TaxID=289476 RepID=A0AA39IAC7_9BILA|nr:hypothetical protein QR680_014868 [Steinernema hermaphroditum]
MDSAVPPHSPLRMMWKSVVLLLLLSIADALAGNASRAIVFSSAIEEFYQEALKMNSTPKEFFDLVALKFPEHVCDVGNDCIEAHKWLRKKEYMTHLDLRIIVSMGITSALLFVIIIVAFVHFVVLRHIPVFKMQENPKLLAAARRIAEIMRKDKPTDVEKVELGKLARELFNAQNESLLRDDEHKKAFPLDFQPDTSLSADQQLKQVLYGDPKNKPVQLAQEARDDI